jgi:hypothetical protein
MKLLSHAGYGDTAVRWQHLSTGNASSKNLTGANGNFQEYYTSFAKASLRFEKKRRDIKSRSKIMADYTVPGTRATLTNLMNHPVFPSEAKPFSDCAHELLAIIDEFCLTNSTPLYAFSSSHMTMTMTIDGEFIERIGRARRANRPGRRPSRGVSYRDGEVKIRDNSRSRRRRRRKQLRERSNLPKHLIRDGILSSLLPSVTIRITMPAGTLGPVGLPNPKQEVVSGRTAANGGALPNVHAVNLLNGIDLYFGMAMSGTFMHTHGTAVASGSGRKLWILYSPEMQCSLGTPSGARMLANANLPPLCDETAPAIFNVKNKHHPNSSLCLGHLHPLEMLRKMVDLEEAARPMLVLTNGGDTLLLPERWMHMTINFDDQFTVSYRFHPSWPVHLGCSTYGCSEIRDGNTEKSFEVDATGQ